MKALHVNEMVRVVVAAIVMSGCHGAASTETSDAAPAVVDMSIGSSDMGTAAKTACPTAGKGAVTGEVDCLLVTPVEAGASSAGTNADKPSYVLAPKSNPRGELVLFLNGSLATPAQCIADPVMNFYTAAVTLGYHVIALSYSSADLVGQLCNGNDACFFPTRATVILGRYHNGAASSLAGIQLDEGIADRLLLTLRWLDAHEPSRNWAQFIRPGSTAATPEQQIAWEKLVAAGHSQGGGHAAAIGKMFPVARVIQLSSTCDQVNGAPATWTSASSQWQSEPRKFFGIAAPTMFSNGVPTGGDTTCPYHAAVWKNLAMLSGRSNDAASTACGCTGFGQSSTDTHCASLLCKENFAAWQSALQ